MNRTRKVAIILAVATMALAVLYIVNPSACRLIPPCPFHILTGLHCPGCGSTRALHQLVHGDVTGAIRLNPLTVMAVMAFAVSGCFYRVRQFMAKPWVVWSVVTVVVAFGILRNIPAYPFVMLKP